MNPIHDELKALLNTLNAIGEEHEEIGDTDVREQMSAAISHGFLNPIECYNLPDSFGMFSDGANKYVKTALNQFLATVTPKIGSPGLETPKKRLNAFQDDDVESDDKTYYDDYFGYAEGIE